MRKIIRFLLVLPFGMGLGIFVQPHFLFCAEPNFISIALPAASLEVSDLDARDALNRPIRTIQVRQNFEKLWLQSLHHSLINSLTPARLCLLALLNITWDGSASLLCNSVEAAVLKVNAWIQEKKKPALVYWVLFASQVNLSLGEFYVAQRGTPFLFYLQAVLSSTYILR